MLILEEEFGRIPSLCTESQIEDAIGKIDIGIKQMLEDLATLADNCRKHEWHDFHFIQSKIGLYGKSLSGIEPQLLMFAGMVYWCHDIGRLFEGCCVMTRNNAVAVPITYENHGPAGAHIVLRRIEVGMVIDERARQVFDYAISNHHQRFLPEIGGDAGDCERTKDFFARLVRDLDIMVGLIEKTDKWLKDLDERREEMAQYGINGECAMIMPTTALEDFAKYLPIDVESIRGGGSWEAYLLSHLAWVFNISFRETLEILVREHAIEKYLDYFSRRFGKDSEEYLLIRDTVRRYFDEQRVGYEF